MVTRCYIAAASLLLCAAAGCDQMPEEPETLSPADLVGTFYLDSIQGRALPFQTGNVTYHLALLTLRSDETATLMVDSGFCNPNGYCDELVGAHADMQWVLLADMRIQLSAAGTVTDDLHRAEATKDRLQFGSAIYKRVQPTLEPGQIDIRPDSLMLRVGEARNVFATTYPYVPKLSVTVRDTTVAAIGAIAVTGRRPGTTYVVAVSGALRDSSKITVTP